MEGSWVLTHSPVQVPGLGYVAAVVRWRVVERAAPRARMKDLENIVV